MRIVMSFEKPRYNMHQQHKFAVSLMIPIMAVNIHNHPSKNTDIFTQEGGWKFSKLALMEDEKNVGLILAPYCLQYLYAMTFLRKK